MDNVIKLAYTGNGENLPVYDLSEEIGQALDKAKQNRVIKD